MKKVIKIISLVLLILAVFILVFIYLFIKQGYVRNGYQLSLGRADNWSLSKNDEIVIGPAILDYWIVDPYIYGVRVVAKNFECDGGYSIRLTDNTQYFIVNTETDEINNFSDRSLFEVRVDEIDTKKEHLFDYGYIERMIARDANFFEKYDASKCVEMNN